MFVLKSFFQKSLPALSNQSQIKVLGDVIQSSSQIQQTIRTFKRLNDKRIRNFGFQYSDYYKGGLFVNYLVLFYSL
jgi:hypothetical protein